MAYVVAALVAAVLAFIEVRSRLQSRPTAKGAAKWWWFARLALEAAIGVVGATLVTVTAGGALAAFPDWLTVGLGGGLAGPAVARITFATIGKGGEQRAIGIASFYDPVRDHIEERLDEICADESSRWIHDEVLPVLRAKPDPSTSPIG